MKMTTSRELIRLAVSQALTLELEAEEFMRRHPDNVGGMRLKESCVEHKRHMIQVRNHVIEILNDYNALINKYEVELSKLEKQ
jgi:hypothetical protein